MVWFESDGEFKIMENAIKKKGLLLALCEKEHATFVKKEKFEKKMWNKDSQKPNFESCLFLVFVFSPLTPMSDQDRISPHNINTISIR